MTDDYLLAQGQAKPATEEDLIKDAAGITHPNLHRRIDLALSPRYGNLSLQTTEGDNLLTSEGNPILVSADLSYYGPAPEGYVPEYDYTLSVQGVNSYRNTRFISNDEDSEIP